MYILVGSIYGVLLGLYWGYIGIMEKKMETTRVYKDSIEYIMQL